MYREALDTSREAFGDRHERTLISTGHTMPTCSARRELPTQQGRREMGVAPDVAREVLGVDHIATLVLEAQAARIRIALGEADINALREVVARMEAALGAERPQTRKCLFCVINDLSSAATGTTAFSCRRRVRLSTRG